MFALQYYTTQQGDTVSGIASRYGVGISDVSGYASGDPNKIGIGEKLAINTPNVPAANTMNAGDLTGNMTPYKTSVSVPNASYAGLITSANAAIKDLTVKKDESKKDLTNTYDALSGMGAKQVSLYTSEGVYDKQKAYTDLVNTINAKDLAHQRVVEKIQEDNPTGQLTEGQKIAIDKAEKEWAREKADLSVAAAFAKDDYTTAKQIIDDKIAAETQDLKIKLEEFKTFYSENSSNLTDKQKEVLSYQIKQLETEHDDKKAFLSDLGSIQLKAAQNGAPTSVILAIGKSSSISDAISNAGSYLKNDGSNITYSDTQLAKGAQNAGVNLQEFSGLSKDAQNVFINGDVKGAKEAIDSAFYYEGASLDDVKKVISDMGLPKEAADILTKYAEDSQNKNSIDTRLKDLQDKGYSRSDAQTQVENDISENGKYEIPSEVQDKIDQSVKDIYGKSFWQSLFGK